MKNVIIAIALAIFSLCMCGCEEEGQSKAIPVVVEGDETAKAAIEEVLMTNPNIFIPNNNTSGSDTEYAMQIVKPDPSENYNILRVSPDSNSEYSMMIIDPKTQKPPANIDPKTLETIVDQIKKRKQEAEEK